MKKKYFFIILLTSMLGYSQVGINSSVPSSSLDVSGSIEGNYKEISDINYTLLNTDYHVSFSGKELSTFTLPKSSSNDNTINDFKGRKYYIKNNSTTSNLILNPASNTETLRTGGSPDSVNTLILNPGTLVLATANGNNGWDIDITLPQPSNSWKLYYTDLNGFINRSQSITSDFTTIDNCSITIIVPPGVESSKVLLNFNGWGEIQTSSAATGSLRFQLIQTGTKEYTYKSIMMSSWSTNTATGTKGVRYSFPISYSINNLSAGTYTFTLQAKTEAELIDIDENKKPVGEITRKVVYGVQSSGQVYIKN